MICISALCAAKTVQFDELQPAKDFSLAFFCLTSCVANPQHYLRL